MTCCCCGCGVTDDGVPEVAAVGGGAEPHRVVCSEPLEGALEHTVDTGDNGGRVVVEVVLLVAMTTVTLECAGSVSVWLPAAGLDF